MSVQKFLGTIETDGIKDEMGIETPSLSATGEVSGKTGVFSESVTAPAFNGKATNATNDGEGNNIPNTYATKAALAEETSAREAADETLSKGITAEATARAEEISALQTSLTSGGITVANATNIIPNGKGAVNPLGRKDGGVVGDLSTALGNNSTASGNFSTALGSGSVARGDSSTALGGSASALGGSSIALGSISSADGAYSIALGSYATAGGAYSIALGGGIDQGSARGATASGDYSTAIGYDATTSDTDSKTMQLGGNDGENALSVLRCKVNLTVTSDKRDKTDIKGITDALAFIERLNPVTFVSNDRVDYISDEDKKGETFRKYGMCEYDRASHAAGTKKGERRRCGLLAQEVVEAMQSVYGTDNYANVVNDNFHDLAQKPSDVENKYTLAYANLVPFLIGAIKELNEKIKALSGAKEH